MKVQIVHDRAGSILAAFAQAGGERRGHLIALEPDQTVADVDLPDAALSDAQARGEEASRHLADLVENYRFDAGRLVNKATGA
jgi:hypothetical protein